MNTKMNLNNNKGFSLIELMIVVAIIGILSAIAIPQFYAYRTRAYNSVAASDLKSLQTAFEVYFNDNDQYPASIEITNAPIAVVAAAGPPALTAFAFTMSNNVSVGTIAGVNNQTYGASTKNLAGDITYNSTSAAPVVTETTVDAKGVQLSVVIAAPI